MILFSTLLAQFGTGLQAPSRAYSDPSKSPFVNLEDFISTIVGLITVFAGVFFIVNFSLAALAWVTAGGDSGKISSARDRMIQSGIGLIVVVAGYGIVGLIGAVVGLNILEPAAVLQELIPGN